MNEKYNNDQCHAIKYPAQPLLILAGAGTGKTTTIVGRMAYLIHKFNATPESILALTFTNDSADHLKQKLIDEIGDKGSRINACTFHSFAQTIILSHYIELGYTEAPKIMSKGDSLFLLRTHLNKIQTLRSTLFRRDPLKAIQSFQKVFDAFRQNLLTQSELQSLQQKELNKIEEMINQDEIEIIYQLADMVDIYPYYQNWKKKTNWIDYCDMIINLWELINSNGAFLSTIQKQYKHIIVDEFQDNNYALSRIIEKIALPNNSITVVGDDDQCIYAFRQANIQNVHQFKDKYYKKSLSPISLMQNYRTCQPILDLANAVISQNRGRIRKVQLVSEIKQKQRPIICIGTTRQQLVKLGEDISKLIDDGESLNNIAVLLRTHSKCLEVSSYLKELGICTYYFAEKLYEQKVIKDIISILHILGGTDKSDHAFLRLLIKDTSYKQISELTQSYTLVRNDISLIEYTLQSRYALQKKAVEIIETINHFKRDNISELIWQIIKSFKLYKNRNNHESLKQKSSWQGLNQFRKIAYNYCQNYDAYDINIFIEFIEVQSEVNTELVEPISLLSQLPAIQVMTIHSAKGLEFKHVMIPFLRSGSFPLHYRRMKMIDRIPVSWQRWEPEGRGERELHYEEECRLFYVGITRAMQNLTIYAPQKSQSSFIKDINNGLLQKEIIMSETHTFSKLDELIGNYKSQLQAELDMEHFETAASLVQAIKNISNIKKMKEPEWDDNPFRNEVNNVLDDKKIELNLKKPSLSATSIQTYNQCPLKYKYKYIDAIPSAPEKLYFQLGKVIHKVLELFHKLEYNSLEDLLRLLDENWQEGGYKYKLQEEQNRLDANNMLNNYWQYFQNNPVNKIITEHWFSFETEHAYLSGKCDRIDINKNDKISIIDYKTSKISKTENEIKKDIQLGIYALFSSVHGVEMNDGKIIHNIPEKISMLFLRENNPEVTVQFNSDDIEKFNKQIKLTAESIKRCEFEGSKGKHCEWCDFRELICPLFG